MISFCDLPFSEMGNYLGKYGDYSIGLSKEWGIRNKANPVWYCNEKSLAVDSLQKDIENAGSYDFLDMLAYIKEEEGELKTHGRVYKKYRYIDEREIRLVLPQKHAERAQLKFMLTDSEYETYKHAHNGRSILPHLGIKFEWSDVKYIIVQNEANIEEFRSLLTRLNCTNNYICIFSQQQVKDDFIGSCHDIESYDKDENPVNYII